MRDSYQFSDAQDLTGLNSTGEVSDNVWDLETDVTTDQQVMGCVNVLFGASNAGATEGMYIELRTSDTENLASGHKIIASILLNDAELTAMSGKAVALMAHKSQMHKYLGLWYKAHTTSLAGTATPVDAWFSQFPVTDEINIQKKPQ